MFHSCLLTLKENWHHREIQKSDESHETKTQVKKSFGCIVAHLKEHSTDEESYEDVKDYFQH